MNQSQLAPILAAVAIVLALVACETSVEPQGVIIPTALTCADCPTMDVTKTIDGDTLETTEGSVRLFGVDTQERGEGCAKQATARLTSLAGNTIRVEAGPRATGPNGRSLFYVYTMAGNNVEAILIREGLARAWAKDGQHRGYLVSLEESARELGIGCLWRE